MKEKIANLTTYYQKVVLALTWQIASGLGYGTPSDTLIEYIIYKIVEEKSDFLRLPTIDQNSILHNWYMWESSGKYEVALENFLYK